MFTFISNSSHYKEVLSRVQSVKHTILSQKVCLRYRIEKRDLSSLTGPEKSVPLLC